jgi:hypothetical protein
MKSYQKEKGVIEKRGLSNEDFEILIVNCHCGRNTVSVGY